MCNDPNVTERKSAPLLDNRQNKGDRDRSPVGTKEIKRIANNARFAAGGQCDQCAGLLVGYSCSLASPYCDVFQVCDPIFVRLYSFKNFSRTNAHGANLSCSCSLTAFLRCFFLDEDNFFNDLSVIVDTCNPVRTVHRTTALVMVTPALWPSGAVHILICVHRHLRPMRKN